MIISLHKIKTIVISTQHDDFDDENVMLNKIKSDIINILIPRILNKNPDLKNLFNDNVEYLINPTGKVCYWWTTWRYRINRKKNYRRHLRR